MSSNETLDAIKNQLTGAKTEIDAANILFKAMPDTPASRWYVQVLESYSLAGTTFCLPEEEDLSEMGVEMCWMSPKESLDEMSNAYPGIAACSKGYVPVGICLEGSGDPYFIKITSNDRIALVRIPHDACRDNELDESQVELVCQDVNDFFTKASIE